MAIDWLTKNSGSYHSVIVESAKFNDDTEHEFLDDLYQACRVAPPTSAHTTYHPHFNLYSHPSSQTQLSSEYRGREHPKSCLERPTTLQSQVLPNTPYPERSPHPGPNPVSPLHPSPPFPYTRTTTCQRYSSALTALASSASEAMGTASRWRITASHGSVSPPAGRIGNARRPTCRSPLPPLVRRGLGLSTSDCI